MLNNNERDNMNNLKVEIIKKLLMLDTKKELINVRECINEGISNELDNDEKDQKEYAKWKEMKAKEVEDEIPF
jgi:hypothetical protein|tara:strand:+ start:373 stop:591 length:219 start_codon:yes stop_codon:yes gene_type:complete